MKNLPLSLIAVLTLATVTPVFADEIGPGRGDFDPDNPGGFTTSTSTPIIAEPEDDTGLSEDEVSLTDYLVNVFTL